MDQSFSEAEVWGSIIWLWMQSEHHKDFPLHTLPSLLLPAIKNRQFVLAIEDGNPVFYLSWASFNEEEEHGIFNRTIYNNTQPIRL